MTETIWPTKPKILTIWCFAEKADPVLKHPASRPPETRTMFSVINVPPLQESATSFEPQDLFRSLLSPSAKHQPHQHQQTLDGWRVGGHIGVERRRAYHPKPFPLAQKGSRLEQSTKHRSRLLTQHGVVVDGDEVI